MANLTVAVDSQVLKRARIRALEQGTSVNAVLSEYLASYAGLGATASALADFLELAEQTDAGSEATGRSWRREDIYDRPILR